MSVIRVSNLDEELSERDLKIYFSKPERGGGPIVQIYYPLFNNDAVIFFRSDTTADTLIANDDHRGLGRIDITRLATLQVFPRLEAEIDSSVASFLLATEKVKDEIEYDKELQYRYDEQGDIISVSGNWFQLEWAWCRIGRIMNEQSQLQKRTAINNLNRQLSSGDRAGKEASGRTEIRNARDTSTATPDIVPVHNGDHRRYREPQGFPDDDEDQLATKDTRREQTSNDQRTGMMEPNGRDQEPIDENEGAAGRGRELKPNVNTSVQSYTDDDDTTGASANPRRESSQWSTNIEIVKDDPRDVRSIEFRFGPLLVGVYTGNILLAETEVLVNAAMGALIHAGGVAKAISDAASPDLETQCRKYISRYGEVPTTQVMHTCAGGRLSKKVKYVIHAVGPFWVISTPEKDILYLLTNTFLNAFVHANDVLGVRSLTAPLISSGVFGCPIDLCSKAFLNAILLFPTKCSQSIKLQEVHLVNNSEKSTSLTVTEMRELMKAGTKQLIADAMKLQDKPAQQLSFTQSVRLSRGEKRNPLADYGDLGAGLGGARGTSVTVKPKGTTSQSRMDAGDRYSLTGLGDRYSSQNPRSTSTGTGMSGLGLSSYQTRSDTGTTSSSKTSTPGRPLPLPPTDDTKGSSASSSKYK